jgi:photosystem II stability/assembly factor-like uncharacterized protein
MKVANSSWPSVKQTGGMYMAPGVRAVGALLLMLFWVGVLAQNQGLEPRPAVQARLAPEALALDVVQAGQRYVGVGERGHVLISSDGRNWEQAEFVPVQATLTRVAFAGGRLWAVGHDATIIHSRDMGRTWSLQHFEPEWEKPLLDVHFFNANEGVAVGAYGLYMRTSDAGQHWEVLDMADLVTSEAIDWEEIAQATDEFDDFGDEEFDDFNGVEDELYDAASDFDRGCYEFMECHLNAFLDLGNDRYLIAAERGYGYRSDDAGQNWEAFRFPYAGSMFGLLQLGDGSILAFGLRGHVQYSTDFGESWEILDSGLQSSLKGGSLDPQGRPLMVGAGAARLHFHPASRGFQLEEDRLGSTYAAVIFTDDGTMILAGEDGLTND